MSLNHYIVILILSLSYRITMSLFDYIFISIYLHRLYPYPCLSLLHSIITPLFYRYLIILSLSHYFIVISLFSPLFEL